ncbi:hypothetical protein IFM89_006901 [Coptis chinensis]|uniref:Uncharacterized protein n=1 Tax=Coptis chinensis TaxID=261450 RepID=A0A835LD28_9MAGN|nr:hypothetical protein IFM89_006901 [Coptis chinensis]
MRFLPKGQGFLASQEAGDLGCIIWRPIHRGESTLIQEIAYFTGGQATLDRGTPKDWERLSDHRGDAIASSLNAPTRSPATEVDPQPPHQQQSPYLASSSSISKTDSKIGLPRLHRGSFTTAASVLAAATFSSDRRPHADRPPRSRPTSYPDNVTGYCLESIQLHLPIELYRRRSETSSLKDSTSDFSISANKAVSSIQFYGNRITGIAA